VDVVDHRHARLVERQHGQLVGQVVGVDDVGREGGHDLGQRRRRVVAEQVPGFEELVAGPVELAQRPPAVGEAELGLAGEAHGIFQGPHAGLLLEEEDPHQQGFLIVGGRPRITCAS
jgi:hypothetical protein